MAHITGGGLKENIIRVVPEGLGLSLEASTIVLPPVFDWLMHEGKVAREEMWRTFNCGVGFTVILPRDAVEAASALLAKHGLSSSVIGEIVTAQGDERVHIG
jgi:phosphoribosylformylglycinamidine cyclo-ligase